MSKEIPVSEWSQQWLDRTLPSLHCETMVVVYALTLTSLFIGIRALLRVHRTRKELEANPSDRQAILADCGKRMAKSTKILFFFGTIYLFHALAIWLADAAIGMSAMYEDVNANPEYYNMNVWLDLAIESASMFAIFAAVFIVFPMVQVMGVAYLVKKTLPKDSDGTLSSYISEGRIITTHLAQLWLMVGFCIVAWWPVFESALTRLVILEAVFGSGLTWLHASFAFNFRPEALCTVLIVPLAGVTDHVKLYGKHVVAVYSEKTELLPKYEDAEPNEKSGLETV